MIPKSLHTVTALVSVARHLRESNGRLSALQAICAANKVLGYDGVADVHGLTGKALKVLAKESDPRPRVGTLGEIAGRPLDDAARMAGAL